MSAKQKDNNFIRKLATVIVDKRYLFFLLYAFALVFCIFSSNWVEVERDVTTYLPDETETRQGLVVMDENFTTLATARLMVSNVTYHEAEDLCATLEEIEGVDSVEFDDSEDHYRNAAALFNVSFTGVAEDESTLQAMSTIREKLSGYDLAVDSEIGADLIADLNREMTTILIIAVVIIIAVLTLTSRAYAEVPVLLITFGMAAALNKGTNFLCGKISFISDSIAVVLQLALAIDYAIILCHRFSDEHETQDAREACITALSKAIPEISASSLTTISGLIALSFMQFAIGLDMSIVLIKAVLLSLLSVFTLMPGLLVLFSPLIDRTRHKKLLPNITPLGKFAVASRRVMPAIFAVVLIAAGILAQYCPYCYSYTEVETAKMSQAQMDVRSIRDTFGSSNMVALVVPSGNYPTEQAIMQQLEGRPEVKDTLSLSGMEVDDYHLTDALRPRQFSELIGLDYEVAQALYGAYALDHSQYGELLSGLSDYDVPLFDMFLFLRDQMESRNITLSGDMQETLDDLFAKLDNAQLQLQNDRFSRMVVYLNLPEESPETFDFLSELHSILGQYYPDNYYVVGNSTSARDLADSFARDNLLISLLSALFVILVLLFTFQSVGLPVLLIVVIQGSIWINFSVPTLTGQPLYFLGYLIVNAIQMGANIDYAIVISSHYQELKSQMPHKEAIVQALNASFPTVFTSGTIMASAGLLIGNLSAQPVISIMGTCLGRGTIISIVLVLCVLPAVLVLGDSIIERTKFKLKGIDHKIQTGSGTVKLKGHVRGYVSGVVDADFDGLFHGDFKASITTEKSEKLSPEDAPKELTEGDEHHA